jgi:uncharacterized protein YbjT (DUF2867 family)
VVYGDFDDPDSIIRAAAAADAMFATGTAHRAGLDGELRHGQTIARAAAAADVPHLVYSSGDGASPDSPLPLFRVKYEVEEHIRALPIAHTILAPVYFMENLFNPWNLPTLQAGTFTSPIPVDLPLQQVAIQDLVTLAAIAIERPAEFVGQRVRIASAELTAEQAASELSYVVGRRFVPEHVHREQLAPGLRALLLGSSNPDTTSISRLSTLATNRSAGTATGRGFALSARASASSARASTPASASEVDALCRRQSAGRVGNRRLEQGGSGPVIGRRDADAAVERPPEHEPDAGVPSRRSAVSPARVSGSECSRGRCWFAVLPRGMSKEDLAKAAARVTAQGKGTVNLDRGWAWPSTPRGTADDPHVGEESHQAGRRD